MAVEIEEARPAGAPLRFLGRILHRRASHTTYRVRALRANPDVAISVDTESFPPEVLSIRGRAEITEVDGVATEYAWVRR